MPLVCYTPDGYNKKRKLNFLLLEDSRPTVSRLIVPRSVNNKNKERDSKTHLHLQLQSSS